MPLSMSMGAKAWHAPGVKVPGSTPVKKKEENSLAKALDKEASKLVRQTIRESGRLIAEEQKDHYLARLKADVAKLEAKQTASAGSKTLEEKAAAKKADPLEKRRKEHERAMMEKAERRRQELFGYRPTFDRTQYASQANRKRLAPLSLYEDPEFRSLEAPDRRRLELMPPEERLHYGFGPYPADAAQDATLEDKLRIFQCTAAASLPGVLEVFDRIDNARAVQLPDLSQLSSNPDLSAAQEIIDEAAFALQDELTLFAIEHYGASALLSFAIEGPLPVQDEELVAQGYLYELAASGIPALLRTIADPPRQPFATNTKSRFDVSPVLTRMGAPHPVNFADSPLFGHVPPARPATTPPPREPYAGGFDAHYSSPFPSPYQPRVPIYHPQPQSQHYCLFTDPPPRAVAPPTTHHAARPFLRSRAAAAAGPPIPPEVSGRPWGAQMYVKRIRALQEEEERERAVLARRTSFANPMTATATGPGLFTPRQQQQQHYQQHATWAPWTSMDPDHGGGGVGVGFGASGLPPTESARPPTPMAPAPTPVMLPSREDAWRGAQPW